MRPLLAARRLRTATCIAALVLAAVLPPAALVQPGGVLAAVDRAWAYFWSMIFGASPFLALGAVVGAMSDALPAARRDRAIALAAVCLPGCDCSLNAYCGALAKGKPQVSGFLAMWAACCNPLALVATAFVLGSHALAVRIACGAAAGLLTAFCWQSASNAAHSCDDARRKQFFEHFSESAARGFASFSLAAGVAALILTGSTKGALVSSGFGAALLGALISPCSSADALLARVLFAHSKSRLVFVVAAQCLDVRQFLMLRSTFGWRKALSAMASGAAACVVAYLLM